MRIKLLVGLLVSWFVLTVLSSAEVLQFYGKEVVVTASRMPQELGKSPWSVTVVKGGKAKTFGAETVADVLRFIPGVDLYAAGGQGALNTARIKGSNAAQVLVLVDGCRVNSPLLGTVDFGDIPLSNVEKIEVVSSPLSSVHGSDAISGVINIITKKSAEISPLSSSVALGSFGKQKIGLSFEKDQLVFTSLYDKADGFRDNSDFVGQNYSFSNIFETKGGTLRVGADYYSADKGVPGVPDDVKQLTTSSTPDNRQQDKNTKMFMEYGNSFGASDLSASVYQYSTDQKYHEYNFATATFSDQTYKTSQLGVSLKNKIALRGENFLNVGLEYEGKQGESSNIGDQQVISFAGYINSDLNQGPLTINLGVRSDRHSTAGGSVVPGLGVSLRPSQDLKFFGNISAAFRAPTLNEMYWNDPLWQMYGDANLKPEKSVGIEVGMNKEMGTGSVFGLTLFARQVTDQILWEFSPTTFVTQAKNVGKVEVSGLDLKHNLSLGKGVGFFANATLQNAIDKEDVTAANVGKDIPYSPETKANVGINWENRLGNFALLAKHVGERYSDAGNTNKLEAYTLTDLNYSREAKGFNLFAKISNLFNTSYSEAVGWHPVTYTIMGYPMPGRNYTLGASYKI